MKKPLKLIAATAVAAVGLLASHAAYGATPPFEPAADTGRLDSLKQLREEDDAVYKSMRGICRGC